MKRTAYCGVLAGTLIAVTAAAVLAQTRTRTSSSGQRGRVNVRSAWSGDSQVDLGLTPAERHAEYQRRFQERMAEMQRQAAEMQRRAEESRNNAIRQAVRATDEQWRQIKPKLDLIEKLKAEANVAVEPGTFGGMSGFQGNAFSFGGGFAGGAAGGDGFGAMGGSGRPGQNWSQFKSWSWSPWGISTDSAGQPNFFYNFLQHYGPVIDLYTRWRCTYWQMVPRFSSFMETYCRRSENAKQARYRNCCGCSLRLRRSYGATGANHLCGWGGGWG